MSRCSILAGLALVLVFAVAAEAALTLSIGPVGSEMSISPSHAGTTLFQDHLDGTFDWEGSATMAGVWSATWDLFLDTDPGVAGVVGLTNMTAITQPFTYSVSVDVSGTWPIGSFITGSSTISVGDANFSGSATLSAVTGGAIYSPLIDNVLETQGVLFPDPYALTVNSSGGTLGDSQNFTGATTKALSDSLSILHVLNLSPGDQATANSTLFVIPEPSSIVVMGVAALCLATGRPRSRRTT